MSQDLIPNKAFFETQKILKRVIWVKDVSGCEDLEGNEAQKISTKSKFVYWFLYRLYYKMYYNVLLKM